MTVKSDSYNDIINLPHHVSQNRKRMSVGDRAAQFSPFAALKGFDDEIDEAARFTESKIEPDGARAEEINEKLLLLNEQQRSHPSLRLTYFVADGKKSGGKYLSVQGRLKKFDVYNRTLTLEDGACVSFEDIFDIELH